MGCIGVEEGTVVGSGELNSGTEDEACGANVALDWEKSENPGSGDMYDA